MGLPASGGIHFFFLLRWQHESFCVPSVSVFVANLFWKAERRREGKGISFLKEVKLKGTSTQADSRRGFGNKARSEWITSTLAKGTRQKLGSRGSSIYQRATRAGLMEMPEMALRCSPKPLFFCGRSLEADWPIRSTILGLFPSVNMQFSSAAVFVSSTGFLNLSGQDNPNHHQYV